MYLLQSSYSGTFSDEQKLLGLLKDSFVGDTCSHIF